jgi:hypothetical protein
MATTAIRTATMKATATVIVTRTGAGKTGMTEDTTAKTGSAENTNGVSISAGNASGANSGTGTGIIAKDTSQAVTFTSVQTLDKAKTVLVLHLNQIARPVGKHGP